MKQLAGGILLAIGILIAGASGLCSLAVLFGSGELTGAGMWLPVLMFGGIPFAVGAGMGYGGWTMIRRARIDREKSQGEIADIFE